MKHWFILAIAILSETLATTALASAQGFSKPGPIALVVLGYGVSFYCLAQIMKVLPIGITYAIWSGAGITLITLVGWVFRGQKLDAAALLGIGLIVAGVVVLNVFSTATQH